MNRGAHVTFGVCCAITVAAYEPNILLLPGGVEVLPIAAIPLSAVGAWLPDIDVARFRVRDKWKSYSNIAMVFASIIGLYTLAELTGYVSTSYLSGMVSVFTPLLGLIFISWLLSHELKHRTLTHSIYVLAPFFISMMEVTKRLPSAAAMGLNTLTFGLLLGVSSHLIADALTVYGIYLAYPFPLKIHLLPSFLRFNTSDPNSEKLFTVLSTLICAGICVYIIIYSKR